MGATSVTDSSRMHSSFANFNDSASHLSVGIDIVQVSRVRDSIAQFGDAFVMRLFCVNEVDYAVRMPRLTASRLAERFAAKEATIKAFDLSHVGLDWREIEVVPQGHGGCRLLLHGRAAEMTATSGLACVSLSLSHDATYATAVVAASLYTPLLAPKKLAMTDIRTLDLAIRSILEDHGRLSKDANSLSDSADLNQAGMTSHASVNVMLALEGRFDVEFPDHMLNRNVFSSISAIRAALVELGAA